MASSPHKIAPAAVTLDDIARDPARASALPADAVEALLIEHAAVGPLLLGRLLALRGSSRSEPAPPRYIDAKTVAERWGVPESWVYDQARQGKLPSRRLGHYVRFLPAELERFLAEHRQGA